MTADALRRAADRLGALIGGTLWEITAIPDIRRQREAQALHLSDLLREQLRQRHGILAHA